jgi:hypothetical protein
VWSVLTGRAYEGTPSIVLHDVREIETWILRLLSAPVPVPGKTRVEVCVHSVFCCWYSVKHVRELYAVHTVLLLKASDDCVLLLEESLFWKLDLFSSLDKMMGYQLCWVPEKALASSQENLSQSKRI